MTSPVALESLEDHSRRQTTTHAGFDHSLGAKVACQAPREATQAPVPVIPAAERATAGHHTEFGQRAQYRSPQRTELALLRTWPWQSKQLVQLALATAPRPVLDRSVPPVTLVREPLHDTLETLAWMGSDHLAGPERVKRPSM